MIDFKNMKQFWLKIRLHLCSTNFILNNIFWLLGILVVGEAKIVMYEIQLSILHNIRERRGHWTVYFTSPQSFIITFS